MIGTRNWKNKQYQTMDEYLAAEYGETKLKRGRWRILAPGIGGDQHELWHNCNKDDWELEICGYYAYSDFANRPVIPKWRCEICFKQPPDSIVAVWALLEPDATSEEVQDVLKEEAKRVKREEDPDWIDREFDREMEMLPGWDDSDALDAIDKMNGLSMWDFLA